MHRNRVWPSGRPFTSGRRRDVTPLACCGFVVFVVLALTVLAL